jgi:hypothetical protein
MNCAELGLIVGSNAFQVHLVLYLFFGDTRSLKNTETITDATKEVSLEVSAEQTKYMLLSRHQNAGQNHNINIGDRSSKNVAQ